MCNIIVSISKGRWRSVWLGFNSYCEWDGGGVCQEDIYWKHNAQAQEEGLQGGIYFSNLFLLPLTNMLFLKDGSELLFPNELQQIRMLLHEVLNVVCKTTNNEITVEMFSAPFRCRQSIFDLETNIKPWIVSGQGVGTEDLISFLPLLTSYLYPSWGDYLMVLVFKTPR